MTGEVPPTQGGYEFAEVVAAPGKAIRRSGAELRAFQPAMNVGSTWPSSTSLPAAVAAGRHCVVGGDCDPVMPVIATSAWRPTRLAHVEPG